MDTRQLSHQNAVGPYRLISHLGQGGMGAVYKALDTRLDRYVALKFLINAPENDLAAKQRFITEARAASALDHPNICTIYDFGETENNQLYIAMAFYEGQTLDKKISGTPLSLPESLNIITQIAKGLEVAHAHKIVHRDIKPANIILKNDQAKILDFGIAKVESSEASTLTKTGISLGTISYSSPEQLQGHQVDKQTDIWSLGVIFYEMLSGNQLFQESSPYGVMYNILHQVPEPLSAKIPTLPKRVDAILARMLKKEKSERYQSIEEVLTDISRLSSELYADSGPTQIFVQNELSAGGVTESSNHFNRSSEGLSRKSGLLLIVLVVLLSFSGLMLFLWNFSESATEHLEEVAIAESEVNDSAAASEENDIATERQEGFISLRKDILFEAVKSGKTDLVRQFLDQNQNSISIDVADEMEWTALTHACWQGHPDIVNLLLEAGADPSVNQDQALIVSVVKGQLEIVRMLLKFDANPNARDESTVPALMLALVTNGPHRTDLVNDLLLAGADPYGEALGKTPIDLAREMGLSEELERLQR